MKLALSLGLLTGTNLLAGFLVQWYVVVAVGPGLETDALFASMAVPQLVLAVLGGSLTHVLVPVLTGEAPERFRRDSWSIFVVTCVAFTGLAYVLYALAPLWVWIVAPGFSETGRTLLVALGRIQLLTMLFTALSGVLWAVHAARQRFLWPEVAPLFATVTGFGLLLVVLPKYGVVAAAWAGMFRAALQMVLLLPGLGRYCRPDWGSAALQRTWGQVKPLLLGTAYYKTDALVDRALSSMAPMGALSLLYLGQQIYSEGAHILGKAVGVPAVPLLAQHAKRGDWEAFRRLYRRRLLWASGATTGAYLVFLAFGQSLLALLVGRGGVTGENLRLLWQLMVCLVGVLVGGAVGQLTSSAFYAKGDTRTPTRLGILTYSIYVPAKIAAFAFLGLLGLAVSTSVFYFVNGALQLHALRAADRRAPDCAERGLSGVPESSRVA